MSQRYKTLLLLLMLLSITDIHGQSYRVISNPAEAIIGQMVPVPGGSFVLPGTDKPTEVKAFLIGTHEVTQREYHFITGEDPSLSLIHI